MSSPERVKEKRKHLQASEGLVIGRPRAHEMVNGEPFRQLDCVKYNHCLVYAVRRGWGGFSCIKCLDYEQSESILNAAREIASSVSKQRSGEGIQ